ncbi:DAK2 domain-containing protein [Geobacillus kaustophilus NBRC 102445]|uniref:DAK2 domain-containing protein n=1 Tax=Geobacillus thermoleovorans group TaxID=1505648 RepID=UPI0005A6AFA9|nr:DAK2 domain-containing protein [Geobacillus kaustophilus]MED4971700.1 DAK2 domain-containing protein [Geobacillus thermoleovorans]QCK82491.1 DAK2 domain-containing protein [Geobacillus kaustophilus NBRC 102445]
MTMRTLDGRRFADMVQQGAAHLANNAKTVDALNVFPVPDGDTGTNMNLSMTSGAKEVKANASDHIGNVAAALAKGLLMGARGNSGVILSQLFRGFAKAVEGKQQVNSFEFAAALQAGVDTAYKAVMKPVEGTILTVAKEAARKAVEVAKKERDVIAVMEAALAEAKAALQRTPELLPILKEVGVVDSGGQGLVYIYEGFLAALKGEIVSAARAEARMDDLVKMVHHQSAQSHIHTDEIEFGYCTEFMVRFEPDKLAEHPFSEETFRRELSQFGDSLLVVADDELVKVHIHSETPGEVLTYGQRYGSLINIKIENMREQHANIVGKEAKTLPGVAKEEAKPYGIVAVAMGAGVAELFRSIGAHAIIEGGQTMNPSTEEIADAIRLANAETVFVLPNNKNIVMAAKQAAELSEQRVIVIPSKTVPQGLAVLLAFNPAQSVEQNERAMTAALSRVKTGQVTFSVRDTTIDGIEIQKGDYMGLLDDRIIAADKDKLAVTKRLLDALIDEESEIVTILYGEDATESDVETVVAYLETKHDGVEVEVHNGKQPLYPFIISVE